MSNNAFTFVFTHRSTDAVPVLTDVQPTNRAFPIQEGPALRTLYPEPKLRESQLIFEQVPDELSLGQRLLAEPESTESLAALRNLVWGGPWETAPTPGDSSTAETVLTPSSAWDRRVGLGSAFLDPSSAGALTVLAWGADGFSNGRERIWAELQLFIQLLAEHKAANTTGLRDVADDIASDFPLAADAVRATWNSHLLRTAALNPGMLSAHHDAVAKASTSLQSLNYRKVTS
ncbi:hypothetical protein HW450_09075 [Corynebacterium hindlerae]|uniref:Uncharacterized protein n=1 Tax=Corynebacterium hindlerae TaxID=699041 RepID=A0A7G5FD22_9CORY|nr:hypothetical protein [Corynebacterium hindlerae]QMV84513.1 hypothetical protein HW450_09075 [Corynebacterium hindlerae]